MPLISNDHLDIMILVWIDPAKLAFYNQKQKFNWVSSGASVPNVTIVTIQTNDNRRKLLTGRKFPKLFLGMFHQIPLSQDQFEPSNSIVITTQVQHQIRKWNITICNNWPYRIVQLRCAWTEDSQWVLLCIWSFFSMFIV